MLSKTLMGCFVGGFCISLKEPIVTYIFSSDFFVTLNADHLPKNTQLSSKSQPQLFEIQKSILYAFFSFPFFHQIHKSIYPGRSFWKQNQKKGARVLLFYVINNSSNFFLFV